MGELTQAKEIRLEGKDLIIDGEPFPFWVAPEFTVQILDDDPANPLVQVTVGILAEKFVDARTGSDHISNVSVTHDLSQLARRRREFP